MAFYPLECAVGGELAYTVPEEGVARISGVPSEDVALGDFANEPLAVGEYCTLEVEV